MGEGANVGVMVAVGVTEAVPKGDDITVGGGGVLDICKVGTGAAIAVRPQADSRKETPKASIKILFILVVDFPAPPGLSCEVPVYFWGTCRSDGGSSVIID
jgi:hypothetical protein